MNIAIVGGCHDKLDAIYSKMEEKQAKSGVKVDILLICGDFQAVRNEEDLQTLLPTNHHQSIGSFHKYYHGDVKAPVLTIFIGGEAEASGYMRELFYGGWAAPNIYYLGVSGVINVGGLRIGGVSGIATVPGYANIYTGKSNYFEELPFRLEEKVSVLLIRRLEEYKMALLRKDKNIDIMISHQWPKSATEFGDYEELFERAPYLKKFVQVPGSSELFHFHFGSGSLLRALNIVKPTHWFAGQLNLDFSASIVNRKCDDDRRCYSTNFQAFVSAEVEDADYLKILRFDTKDTSSSPTEHRDISLCYDTEWLAVIKKTHDLVSGAPKRRTHIPTTDDGDLKYTPTEDDIEHIRTRFTEAGYEERDGNFVIPHNFEATVHRPTFETNVEYNQPPRATNPQTNKLLTTLGLEHRVTVSGETSAELDALFEAKPEPLPPKKVTFAEKMRMKMANKAKSDGIVPVSGNNVCGNFNMGYCVRGRNCSFKHISMDGNVVPNKFENRMHKKMERIMKEKDGNDQVCWSFYDRGHCQHGNRCKYDHIPNPSRKR